MSDDINWGRWILNRIPYVSSVIHDVTVLRRVGRKLHKFPRLFDNQGVAIVKLKRRYPPRLIWVVKTRGAPARIHYRLWSQHVK